MATTSGVAGRTNYAKWDRVASDLIEEVEEEEKKARVEDKAAVGLDGKYAVSAAQAEERTKLNKVQATKKKLEQFQKREQAVVQTLTGLFGDDEKEPSSSSSTTVRVTRKDLEAGKRVVSIGDTEGRSWKDTIVLTADLSLMESQLGQQPAAKSFVTDVENDAAPLTQPRSVFGVIKVFLTNLKNCTVRIKCKIISGCVEMHRCENVQIIIEGGPVATLQADLSSDITVLYRDAPSGKSDSTNGLYWGGSPDDRIFHAGVSNFTITVERDGVMESSIQSDFIKDGAVAVGNAKPEEYQFVTSVVDGQLLTESVVRAGATTGTNARAMTQRELLEEEKRRREAEKMVVAMADSMIQIKDKDGNVLVKKEKVETTPNDDVVEEVMTEGVKDVVAECDQNKARGNEAFGAGEYGQAILLYSLALDKAAELEQNDAHSLVKTDVLYSNRAACFLKLGQHEKAEEDAAKALSINPSNLKANFRKGLALHAMGQYYTALPVLAQAHKMEPKNKQIKQALQFCEIRIQQDQRKKS